LSAGFSSAIISMSAIETREKSSAGKIIGFIGCGCVGLILIGLLVGGGIFYGAMKLLKNNDPYRDSIAAVQSNQDAVDALGEPIEAGFLISGNISLNNGEGTVDFSIPVSGPNGKGSIHTVGTKPSGSPTWTYTTWELAVEGKPEPIQLSR
jgi:hypothetical protein